MSYDIFFSVVLAFISLSIPKFVTYVFYRFFPPIYIDIYKIDNPYPREIKPGVVEVEMGKIGKIENLFEINWFEIDKLRFNITNKSSCEISIISEYRSNWPLDQKEDRLQNKLKSGLNFVTNEFWYRSQDAEYLSGESLITGQFLFNSINQTCNFRIIVYPKIHLSSIKIPLPRYFGYVELKEIKKDIKIIY